MTDDRRHQPLRREINQLVRDPSGRVSEAKLFSIIGKTALLYVFIAKFDQVVADSMVLLIFVAAWIAPDLLKKAISARAGAQAPSPPPPAGGA